MRTSGVARTACERDRRSGRAGRLVLSAILAGLVAALALASSATAAEPSSGQAPVGRAAGLADPAIGELGKAYVEEFYPLWFTYYQSVIVPPNELVGPVEITPLYQIVVAINVDTVYASSFVDISAEPVILTVPSTEAGYSVLNLDPYGTIFEPGIPSKSSGTIVPETVYALIPPGYAGSLPVGAIPVEIPFDVSMLIFRIDRFSPSGEDQTEEATSFRGALRLLPLSDYMADPAGGATHIVPAIDTAVPFKTTADALLRFDPIEFLRQLQTAVHSANTPPLTLDQQALSDAFDLVFGTGGSGLDPLERIALDLGARAASQAIQDNYLDNRGPNNWIHFTNIGAWGDDVLDRASISEFIQFGNGIATAAYYQTFLDGSGEPLDGSGLGGYTLTFPPGGQPPAERFWSVTAYTPEAIELIPNQLEKYAVARYTPGLVTNPDGSVTIYVSQTKPPNVPEANWLPVSSRPFNLMLRVYGVEPGSSVANNTYVPPPVVRYGAPATAGVTGAAHCDPLYGACGATGPAPAETPASAPETSEDAGTAVGQARMPNLRASASARWQDGTVHVTVRVLITKPRLVQGSFLVRVRIPSLDETRLVRVRAGGHTRRTLHLDFAGPESSIGKWVLVAVDPTKRVAEVRNRDNGAAARIR